MNDLRLDFEILFKLFSRTKIPSAIVSFKFEDAKKFIQYDSNDSAKDDESSFLFLSPFLRFCR